MTGGFKIDYATKNEYHGLMKFIKGAAITAATVTGAGLVGIVINHFYGPDASQTVKDILSYSDSATIGGGLLTAYFGLDYLANKSLNQNKPTDTQNN